MFQCSIQLAEHQQKSLDMMSARIPSLSFTILFVFLFAEILCMPQYNEYNTVGIRSNPSCWPPYVYGNCAPLLTSSSSIHTQDQNVGYYGARPYDSSSASIWFKPKPPPCPRNYARNRSGYCVIPTYG
ncbi:uncharacterized protein LOC124196723 [Daphnia pulex]|uniref:uncharacterized protein LOC124196723 n=1 Tax=Daphnia pulex TaxID=6669 RepID=UPI001EDE233E|nr:uncharacterized protein LOC124196723 [Daphnia pulex]